jgi:molecular chaperone DnaK
VNLWDVIPLSLGIELADGQMERIIAANEQIPVTIWRRGAQAFTTQRDGQQRIRFRIYQGERPIAVDNVLIGEVVVNLATARPKGEPQVDCMFKVDHDGILHVRAEDAGTEGDPVEVAFDHIYRLSQEEVAAKLIEAEQHQSEDALVDRLYALKQELLRNPSWSLPDMSPSEALDIIQATITSRDSEQARQVIAQIARGKLSNDAGAD